MSKSYKCYQCHVPFKKETCLKQHVKTTHSEVQSFQCKFCEFRTKYKPNVKEHLKTHFPETVVKSFSCSKCPYKCTSNNNLKSHLRTHTGEKPFACKLCSYTTTSCSNLARHTRTHTKEKPYNCSHCNFACSVSDNLRRHVRFIHTYKGARPFPCSFPRCESKFSDNSGLKTHVSSVHAKKTRFKCPSCPKEFYSISTCDDHIRRRHTKEKPFKCNTCSYTAVSASEVNQHTTFTHGDFLGVECPTCHNLYKNKRSLGKHRSEAHSAPPLRKIKCDMENCEKLFESRSGLSYHIRAFHLKQRPFKCPFCEHSFVVSAQLREHTKTHTGEKAYKCDLCQRCFASNNSLGTHKAIAHSESRSFKCDLCVFSVKTTRYLKNHRATHFPVPDLYECSICKESGGNLLAGNQTGPKLGGKYVFRSKITLKKHMKSHSDAGPCNCHLCEYSATLPSQLRDHLRKIHKLFGQQSPSVPVRQANELGSDKLNQMTAATGNIALKSPGTRPDNSEQCRPCFVRLVRLRPSESPGQPPLSPL